MSSGPNLQRALIERVLQTARPDQWFYFDGSLFKLPLTIPGEPLGFLHIFDRAGAPAWQDLDLHDHFTDFDSTVICGRVAQRVYEEGADGDEYEVGHAVGADVVATGELVRLRFDREEIIEAGQTYRQVAEIPHWTCPDDGTVTLLQRGERVHSLGKPRWFRPSGSGGDRGRFDIVPASRPTPDALSAACAKALHLIGEGRA